MQVSFTPEFAARLRAALNLSGASHNPHGGGNTYELERALDQDLLLTSVGWANSYYSQESAMYTDEWGITWRRVPYQTQFGQGHYTEMVGYPLADDQAIASYQPPDPNRPELYREAERVIRVNSLGPYAQDQRGRGTVLDYRVPVEIYGIRIQPGDIIMGDIDGVLAIPRAAEEEVFTRALTKARAEKTVQQALRAGMKASAAFEQFGIL
jgi:hypothetical protein